MEKNVFWYAVDLNKLYSHSLTKESFLLVGYTVNISLVTTVHLLHVDHNEELTVSIYSLYLYFILMKRTFIGFYVLSSVL
jgi:hypothetical protein